MFVRTCLFYSKGGRKFGDQVQNPGARSDADGEVEHGQRAQHHRGRAGQDAARPQAHPGRHLQA